MSYPPAYGQPTYPYDPRQVAPYGMAPQPPKKSRIGLIIGIVAGVLLLVCIAVGGTGWWIYNRVSEALPDPSVTYVEVAGDRAPTHKVHYLVAGSGQAEITWSTGDGSKKETATVSLPWQKRITVDGNDFWLVVKARGTGSTPSVQLCNIYIDGAGAASVGGDGASVGCGAHFVA